MPSGLYSHAKFPSMVALALVLLPSVWAAPKFKILGTVPGGLFSGVTLDARGNLFGTTTGGGTYNKGTVFEVSPGTHGWTLKIIHNFDGYDGGGGNGGLIFDAAGSMYGTTPSGGSTDGGVLFEMTPGIDGWTYSVLYTFCQQYHCPNGGYPDGVVMDRAGNLYGVAGGGTYSEGVVYKLTPGSGGWKESVLYNFRGTQTGFGPSGPLAFDAAGSLYGTTSGTFNAMAGTVFKLDSTSSGWKHRILWQFNEKDGAGPHYGVVFDKFGALYGTANGGDSSCGEAPCGVAFELTSRNSRGWKESILYGFPKPDNGSFPSSGLVFDAAGNLYGTTSNGGDPSCTGGCGVVYKLTPSADGKWTYSVLHKFTGGDGRYPGGGLALDQKGNLYGTAYNVVFEITP